MSAPKTVLQLVEHFRANIDAYKSGTYNETQLRREFIDPFFDELGWDISNKDKYAEAYKDVVHEDAIKIGGSSKAPDYAFRIGGVRKFFLEAKKPAVNIKEDIPSAYQLRRYAWSAKLPLSILTDFEEFAVYDCRIKPAATDKASTARIMYFTFDEYPSKWDELVAIFSRESILKGAFDKFAEGTKRKRGTTEVDDAFLEDIEEWRKALAQNIAVRNVGLTVRELNTAVQRTIDRIIFLRIAEDRGIEPYGRLQALGGGSNIYQKLGTYFRQADTRYNSGLFHFRIDDGLAESLDNFTLQLSIDDKILKEILNGLYYPESPYEFSVISASILGQVYEQFLGKIIRLSGRSAVVEEKPEIKKAGGVFYTPAYVVHYIVEKTLGPMLAGRTPKNIAGTNGKSASTLRVLDPACGSGSFLIQAFQYLLDWHRDQYVAEGATKHAKGGAPKLYQVVKGEWHLTIAEKRRILLTHIFGVDIDPQAVEVTKLSLLLKVLEGENGDQLARQMNLFHIRALPDLSTNIKCGNSIIGNDFYKTRPLDLSNREVVEHINAFDWSGDGGFKHILNEGGFSAVIGNPPYRRELDYKHLMEEIAATKFGAQYASPRMDLWYYFVHRGLELLNSVGRLGFIINSYWTSGTGAEKLISALSEQKIVDEIFYLGNLRVFRNVSGSHMILLLNKKRAKETITIRHCARNGELSAEPFVMGKSRVIAIEKTADQIFRNGKVDISIQEGVYLEKLDQCPQLSRFAIVRQGIAENPSKINNKTAKKFKGKFNVGDGVFMISKAEKRALGLSADEQDVVHPYHDLRDLDRYYVNASPQQFIIYSTKQTVPDISRYPNLKRHLERFKEIMSKRRETKNKSNGWWHLHWPREENIWKTKKIIALQMAKRPSFAFSEAECYTTFSTNVILLKSDKNLDFYYRMLAVLNSRAIWAWLCHYAKRRGVGLEINGNVVEKIPFPNGIEKDTPETMRLAEMAKARIVAESELRKSKAEGEYNIKVRQIENIETQMDKIIYELFGLTAAEVAEIETETHINGSAER